MSSQPLSKSTVSFGLSLALCSVVNALLVVAKEKSPAVAAQMQKITGHHYRPQRHCGRTFFLSAAGSSCYAPMAAVACNFRPAG